ncbi:MAG: hypothetical protein JRF33_06505 [Deltaproteobacteria bacterium]|nr:hypothetical protein [Deltaproteobacteria bacterium]
MKNEQIKNLLKRLPAHQPADDFTAQTLARLDEHPSNSGQIWRWAAVGALACLMFVLFGSLWFHQQAVAEKQEARRELGELRAEYMRMQNNLHELKMKQNQRLVYLGGTDQAEYVVDLGRLGSRPAARTPQEY